ncbi:type VII secretion protein EccCa [Kutzneria chonburiensis]|uniref:Type VII secretion protein EccCa n=1 Tax=Kutzneria chonburiensis TaxID=1483604 RepID=A0ABV6MXF6_9PSEU|nr:type VII secretion protein EccCa [Kutzneria chonburiensis]
MSTALFRRPPRAPRPTVPAGDVLLQPPPELPKPDTGNVWLTALPALSGLGSVAYLLGGAANPITYVAGSFFLFSSLAMVAGSLLRSRSTQKGDSQQIRRDYLRYLGRMRQQVRRTASAQHESLGWGAPDPEQLWAVAASKRLWERRPTDEDFGVVRIGRGPQYLATQLVPGESGPVEDLDPLAALALKRFISTHTVVPDLPVQVSLRRFAAIGIGGDRDAARAVVRSLVAHVATFHPPQDLRILICTSDQDGPAWGWAKWLPHCHHPDEVDYAGPLRMINPSLVALEDGLGVELTRRPRFNRTAEPDPDAPHVLVVIDGGMVAGTELVLGHDGLQAVTVVDLDGRAGDLIRAHGLELVVDDGEVAVRNGSRLEPLGTADAMPTPVAAALAQQLGGHRLDVTSGADDLATTSQTLPGLLGITDAGAMDLDVLWKPRPLRDRLRVPIGISADGTVLDLDIKESAQDGMGPHGLVVGATGSGKSELLRTLVLGMAATHPPDQLNLVLVDFKGGATFAKMGHLPQVAAVITNLEDDLSLVDRMQEALSGEMNRRQEILRDAGNLVSVRDYERARQNGAGLPPLPSLFVVVDEFSELLSQKPDFADLFVQIGRLGRSLGLHLLLASQRLDEGRLRGLEAHLSYRIGLRTFSAQESRTAIGVPDANDLPNAPGHGFLKTDTATLRRFRAAYVSGAYHSGEDRDGQSLLGVGDVRPFTARSLPVPAGLDYLPSVDDDDEDEENPSRPTMLSVMVDQLIGQGSPAHQVWLPPLDAPDTLDALLPGLAVRPGRGFGAAPELAPLTVPIGTVDRPYHQRRDPMLIDLAGSGGHVAIVGGPRSGKSTMVRTLVAALALRHTPAEIQVYCLDFSGTLFAMSGLPHVGRVAGRQDNEVVRRTVAEVSAVVERRETRFRELGVDTMADYRRLRAEGKVGDDPFGDVFLVVDGWSVLRQDYEDLEAYLLNLVGRSLTYGVHMVLTANRWLDLRLGLRDLIGAKIELKLGDALDSEIDRKAQQAVPADRPGRGVTRERLHFLGAVPRVDGRSSADDLAVGIADLITKINENWSGQPAPAVRLLPRLIEFRDLPAQPGITIGVEGQRLEPIVLADQGLVLIGDSESGKTSTLRAIARQVVARGEPKAAKIALIDYRMTMLGEFEGQEVLAYGTTPQQTVEIVAGLVEGFTKRLPDTDVTPEQLRNRSWWTGPDVHIVVDDYDLVANSVGNPLAPLLDFLPQARNIGLHLYLARQAGGAGSALLEPVLRRMRELSFPAVVLSAPPDEGTMFGVRPSRLPAGRGTLVHRRLGAVPVQLARLDSHHD